MKDLPSFIIYTYLYTNRTNRKRREDTRHHQNQEHTPLPPPSLPTAGYPDAV
ncbi:BDM_1a_G0015810.mRNA.1.CDS.1 [Saccharomyces cerevisiae]|nr:BDM_1a_G0015810.mRNA.1.CDS.1 [Saccharomyces cerevisiae]CAI4978309.1 CGH_1_HP_G0057440.mRNA.1.CDS.1 [Saccharomyces cerevisiae]CAI6803720.1 CGH_1_HP_G0057440.mRNA.1.CDS.1 [Saccharomyces cerevisiae]CAI7104500.1 BDM_1a_G0015810.mRNA.1.CDS.1 [Saccharomyces cerevisiae]